MSQFKAMPWRDSAEGRPRRVGVEMEMAGVDAGQIARAVIDVLGGHHVVESAFLSRVRDTDLGDFEIELDAEVLTSGRYLESLKAIGIELKHGELRENLESVLSKLAGLVVPHELVCPPVAFDALPEIDEIRRRLHHAGAKGTQSSPLYAFGLQFNVEVHSFEPEQLLAVLRAFFVAFPGIVKREGVDFSRKLTPYVQPFPEDYVAHVLSPDYAPDLDCLIDDYLRFTPTRNRPLDLLPLFAFIDRDRVMAAPVERKLIKPRPTWHYRLPNCRINDPDWSLARPWAEWARVEQLAADRPTLQRAARQRLGQSNILRRLVAALWRAVRGLWQRDGSAT
ncbi:MAG: amidoligase family protein [Xanthomonadaceae bacterium]|nr:amidoligase family protein [Xanthomonadaceae bacterium]